MIKVAIELNDSGFENDDISKVKYGNPGWGGSEYLFAELAVYLSERNNGIEVYLFHYNCNKVPFQIKDILIEEPSDLIKYSKEYDIDILIHQVNKPSVWYNELADTNVKVISWAHIYPPYDEYKSMMLLENVKRVIFVGKEEYDAYIDTNLIEKADVVYNMFNTNIDIYERKVEKSIVTYIGSLVPQKGFHILASVWKDIKKAVPDAELMVIGTGQVYDKKSRLGKYGIAQEDYEQKFMPFILDKDGKIMDSVHFLGIMGSTKYDVFKTTKVGVANPSAKTETFCLSAAEMELAGVPVVSRGKWGMFDTVVNGRTGLLCKSKIGLKRDIIKLLKNNSLNKEYGNNARNYVKEKFEVTSMIEKWENVITETYNGKKPEYHKVTGNITNDFKWIKMIVRFFRYNLGIKALPAFNDIKQKVKHLVRK